MSLALSRLAFSSQLCKLPHLCPMKSNVLRTHTYQPSSWNPIAPSGNATRRSTNSDPLLADPGSGSLSLVFLSITTIPLLSIAQKETTLPPSHPLAYHNKIPHPGSLGYKCGHRTAAWHEDDLDGVIVEQFIQVLGGLPWVTLKEGGGNEAGSQSPHPRTDTHILRCLLSWTT